MRRRPITSVAVYIAGAVAERHRIRQLLRGAPRWLESTARWLDLDAPIASRDEPSHAWIAETCLEDLERSDAVVAVTCESGRGMYVEIGYALALAKAVVVVGEPTSSFLYLDRVTRVSCFDDAVDALAVVFGAECERRRGAGGAR